MGKAVSFGVLLVLAVAIAMTTSLVYPPPDTRSDVVEKSPLAISKEKESSSSSSSSSEDSSVDDNGDDYNINEDSSESIDEKEQMLCNVIVRATNDLQLYQSKSANEITTYLNTDCKNLENEELIEECRDMVAEYGKSIYKYATNGMEMSKICKTIEDSGEVDLDDEKTTECSREGGDKCQCCKQYVEKRKMRLRFIVKQIAKKRMCMCKKSPRPQRCREWIRRKEQRILKKIAKICPTAVCKHRGYCANLVENKVASISSKEVIEIAVESPSLWLELLDQQLETHFTTNVCNEFEQLQEICNHFGASTDSHRYTKMYMAMLHNDTATIDNDIREKAQSAQAASNADLCETCKNIVQSSTTFYLQILETVRNALINTCEQYPAKDTCEELINERFNTISAYLHSLKPDKFCSAIPLCSSSSFIDGGECTVCVQRLQPRKDAAIQALNQLSVYFTNICAEWNVPECHQFVSEAVIQARSFLDEFDVQETCRAMGFCEQNAARDVDDYEHALVEEISKQVCSTLGPFETLCQKVVQGDSKGVQTMNLNDININDFFENCEEETDGENAVTTTTDQCTQDKDKCQCCIKRVIQKKKCLRKRVANYVWYMSQLCKRCPVEEKCKQYWEKKKECWDAKIAKICPKKVCIHMGYCNKTDISSMCAYMGPFKQACEHALNAAGQFLDIEQKQPVAVPVGRIVSVQPKDKNEKQFAAIKP